MSKVFCIYHGGCDDGFGAAMCVRMSLGSDNVEFYPGTYAFAPPDVTGRDVVMVDFSYKRPVLEMMIKQCKSLLILDHHKTAQEDLADLPVVSHGSNIDHWRDAAWEENDPHIRHAALFDMDRSGAGIAWDYFLPDVKRDRFIDYLEDRDLWRKQLLGGDEFTIALRSYPQDFDIWGKLVERGVGALIEEGASIQRYYRLRVEELKRTSYPAELGGHLCQISNAPYFTASEVAGELCDADHAAFGACYFEVAPHRFQYSLRSRGGFDVSAVAKQFGGGGHKNAAGFTSTGLAHKR